MKIHSQILLLGTLIAAGILVISASSGIQSASPQAHVMLQKMAVLYIGADNPVRINVDGIDADRVKPTITNGTITATPAPYLYIVRLSSGSKATIKVGSNTDESAYGIFEYSVKKVPDPVTYINDVSNDGVILKENLQNITGVFTRMVNFDFDCVFRPQSFSMSVIEDGEWKEYKAIGPELTPEMKTALTRTEEDDKIVFHNVITKGPLEDVRKVNNVVITVK